MVTRQAVRPLLILSNPHEFITSRGPTDAVFIYQLLSSASLLKIWAGKHWLGSPLNPFTYLFLNEIYSFVFVVNIFPINY